MPLKIIDETLDARLENSKVLNKAYIGPIHRVAGKVTWSISDSNGTEWIWLERTTPDGSRHELVIAGRDTNYKSDFEFNSTEDTKGFWSEEGWMTLFCGMEGTGTVRIYELIISLS